MSVDKSKILEVSEAVSRIKSQFPFSNYCWRNEGAYQSIALTALKYLKPGSRVLDFGAGPADKTAVLQLLGFKCTALDELSDLWHKKDANTEKIFTFANNLGVEYLHVREPKLPPGLNNYDLIMMNDVLEHLHDSPKDILLSLLEILNPGGYFVATVPNAVNIRKRIDVLFGNTNLPCFEYYYWWPGPWRDHVREYVKDDLRKLARFSGLEVVELRGCDHMLHKVPIFLRGVYVATTNIFDAWKDSLLLVARKNSGWQPMTETQIQQDLLEQ